MTTCRTWSRGFLIKLGFILAVATLLRAYQVGRLSFWYDEVVTMRLARSANPSELIERLGQIDATRAPLHPLVLQGWVRVLGPSERSGRAFSVLCGVLTVAWVGRLGMRAFDDPRTGLWAAWLAALSPLLVRYSREARMYAWLVLVTCAAWEMLFSLRTSAAPWRLALYALAVAALVYSHPLGLLMAAALALASLACVRGSGLSWRRWLIAHLAAALAVAPWVGRYFDHEPESIVGRLPLRFLLGLPIGFVGGNFLTLLGFAAVIGFGLLAWPKREDGRRRVTLDTPSANVCLLIWLTVPPLLLYGYSRVSHPVFGPARYTLFVAPAFLILVARGLAKLPKAADLIVGAGASALALMLLPTFVYAPDQKADWRLAAEMLDRLDPDARQPVVVVSNDPAQNVEVETARYYLGSRRQAFPLPADPRGLAPLLRKPAVSRVWIAIGVRDGMLTTDPTRTLRLRRDATTLDVDGLRLIAVDDP
jgi:mannosyltransferase